MTLFEKMKNLGYVYCGEITCFSRLIRSETIGGIYGNWFLHEFGGECFVPYSSDRGYHNKSAFERRP